LSEKNSGTTAKSIEENRIYHKRYLRAINSPLRRKILRALKEGSMTIAELHSHTGLDNNTLKWHLNILEHGYCIERNAKGDHVMYKLTKEGEVINYLE
jgi:DNA-binding transcriptional ArsR family regulator